MFRMGQAHGGNTKKTQRHAQATTNNNNNDYGALALFTANA